jgi:hypothetical protein
VDVNGRQKQGTQILYYEDTFGENNELSQENKVIGFADGKSRFNYPKLMQE